jgi:hypothetical protein
MSALCRDEKGPLPDSRSHFARKRRLPRSHGGGGAVQRHPWWQADPPEETAGQFSAAASVADIGIVCQVCCVCCRRNSSHAHAQRRSNGSSRDIHPTPRRERSLSERERGHARGAAFPSSSARTRPKVLSTGSDARSSRVWRRRVRACSSRGRCARSSTGLTRSSTPRIRRGGDQAWRL